MMSISYNQSESEFSRSSSSDELDLVSTAATSVFSSKIDDVAISLSSKSYCRFIISRTETRNLRESVFIQLNDNEPSETALPVWDIAWNPTNNKLLAAVSIDSITSFWNTSAIPPKNTTLGPENCASVSRKPLLAVAWKVFVLHKEFLTTHEE